MEDFRFIDFDYDSMHESYNLKKIIEASLIEYSELDGGYNIHNDVENKINNAYLYRDYYFLLMNSNDICGFIVYNGRDFYKCKIIKDLFINKEFRNYNNIKMFLDEFKESKSATALSIVYEDRHLSWLKKYGFIKSSLIIMNNLYVYDENLQGILKEYTNHIFDEGTKNQADLYIDILRKTQNTFIFYGIITIILGFFNLIWVGHIIEVYFRLNEFGITSTIVMVIALVIELILVALIRKHKIKSKELLKYRLIVANFIISAETSNLFF